jgi:hypothetical protein
MRKIKKAPLFFFFTIPRKRKTGKRRKAAPADIKDKPLPIRYADKRKIAAIITAGLFMFAIFSPINKSCYFKNTALY